MANIPYGERPFIEVGREQSSIRQRIQLTQITKDHMANVKSFLKRNSIVPELERRRWGVVGRTLPKTDLKMRLVQLDNVGRVVRYQRPYRVRRCVF